MGEGAGGEWGLPLLLILPFIALISLRKPRSNNVFMNLIITLTLARCLNTMTVTAAPHTPVNVAHADGRGEAITSTHLAPSFLSPLATRVA